MNDLAIMRQEDIKVLAKEIVDQTISKTLKETGFYHKDQLLSIEEAAVVFGMSDRKIGAIRANFRRFQNKKHYNPPLKSIRVLKLRFRYGDLIEFIKNHEV